LKTMSGPERLHLLYTIRGTTLGPEAVIDTLPGYAGSRPVRISNAANQQVQLDVFGPVVELVMDLAQRRGELTRSGLADGAGHGQGGATAVARTRQRHLEGTWAPEAPGLLEGHVLGDAGLCTAAGHPVRQPADPAWASLRERIAAEVLERGWSSELSCFTTAYGGTDLDAATLHIGLSGLLPPYDERFQATVTAIEAELRSGATVYRYNRDDALLGREGGFHLCAAWLVRPLRDVARHVRTAACALTLSSCRRSRAARGLRTCTNWL